MNKTPASKATLPKRLSLVSQSVDSLREGIESGHWQDHLPGERELCETLQISRRTLAVFPEGGNGKHAVTHYKVLERFGYVTLVECKLETGRTHQIRVHFKHIGHPLFNDELYGGARVLKGTTFAKYKQFIANCFELLPRQALHAKSLGFLHLTSKKELYFDSELHSDMKSVLEKWRVYSNNKDCTLTNPLWKPMPKKN